MIRLDVMPTTAPDQIDLRSELRAPLKPAVEVVFGDDHEQERDPVTDHARVALRIIDSDGDGRDVTYARLADQSRRLDGALLLAGVAPGEEVTTLLPARWESEATLVASLRRASPFRAIVGPCPMSALPRDGALITTADLYLDHVLPVREHSRGLSVLLAGPGAEHVRDPQVYSLTALMAQAVPPAPEPARAGGTALLVDGRSVTFREVGSTRHPLLGGLRSDDVLWDTTGINESLASPISSLPALLAGATTLSVDGGFIPERWCSIICTAGVTVWAVTADDLRWLMWTDARLDGPDSLRRLVVVGPPPPEHVIAWARRTFGAPVRVGSRLLGW